MLGRRGRRGREGERGREGKGERGKSGREGERGREEVTEGEGEGENEEGKRLKRTKTECAVEDKVKAHKVFHNTNANFTYSIPMVHFDVPFVVCMLLLQPKGY